MIGNIISRIAEILETVDTPCRSSILQHSSRDLRVIRVRQKIREKGKKKITGMSSEINPEQGLHSLVVLDTVPSESVPNVRNSPPVMFAEYLEIFFSSYHREKENQPN